MGVTPRPNPLYDQVTLRGFRDETWSTTDTVVREWEDTELYQRWHKRVATGRPNDFVIALTASSHTGVSGTGKTTCATSMGKEFDITDAGFDADSQGTLRPNELAYDMLPEAEEGDAYILEEAQGTPEGTGLDTRRAMKDEVIATINAILANRDQRLTVIIVAQQLSMIDTRLYPLIDAWCLIRYEPDDKQGPLLTHHKLHVDDYDLKSPDLKTPGVEDLGWPPLPHDDPDYQRMEEKKQVAKTRESDEEDDDQSLTKDQQKELAQTLRDEGWTLVEIADHQMIDYERSWVSEHTVEPSGGETA